MAKKPSHELGQSLVVTSPWSPFSLLFKREHSKQQQPRLCYCSGCPDSLAEPPEHQNCPYKVERRCLYPLEIPTSLLGVMHHPPGFLSREGLGESHGLGRLHSKGNHH